MILQQFSVIFVNIYNKKKLHRFCGGAARTLLRRRGLPAVAQLAVVELQPVVQVPRFPSPRCHYGRGEKRPRQWFDAKIVHETVVVPLSVQEPLFL